MNDLTEFILTTKEVLERVTPETNTIFTSFDSPKDLKAGIYKDLKEIENGNLEKLVNIHRHFLPTSTFQEISINDNWQEEYIEIAARMDELYMRLKPLENKSTGFLSKILNWTKLI